MSISSVTVQNHRSTDCIFKQTPVYHIHLAIFAVSAPLMVFPPWCSHVPLAVWMCAQRLWQYLVVLKNSSFTKHWSEVEKNCLHKISKLIGFVIRIYLHSTTDFSNPIYCTVSNPKAGDIFHCAIFQCFPVKISYCKYYRDSSVKETRDIAYSV